MQADFNALADPAEEVLLRVQPTFIQLAAVPVIDDPGTLPDSVEEN